MKRGICLLSAASLRAEPSHRSELVNQLIFGDDYQILDQRNDWCLIKMNFDHYQGWVSQNQVHPVSNDEWEAISNEPFKTVSTDLIQLLEDMTLETSFAVGAGSTFPFFEKGKFSLAGKVFQYSGEVFSITDAQPERVVMNALSFLNVPYLWGGRSAMGIDCSGLSQLAYKMAGIVIPRDAYMQASQGETIHLINEAMPGDLLFFDNPEQQINHVGILVNEGFIIHAHGKVRIDLIDHQGIYNREMKKYTHQLRIIKRMTSENIKTFR